MTVPKDPETSVLNQPRFVLVEIECSGTAIVTLNRPEKRNALSAALVTDLNAAFRALEQNESVRAIVLTGSPGGPFSGRCESHSGSRGELTDSSALDVAGADLSELKNISTSEAYRIQYLRDLSNGVSQVRKPIIASIEGFAVGPTESTPPVLTRPSLAEDSSWP